MSANDYQPGGSHYNNASGYPHWDWALDINLGCLEYAATKYIARLGKKRQEDTFEALEKVLHYVTKIEENAVRLLMRPTMPRRWIIQRTEMFCSANGIKDEAYVVTRLLAVWQSESELREAKRILIKMVEQNRRPAKPVPLEDSNKHAPREERGFPCDDD
jgi:hypothetical protein